MERKGAEFGPCFGIEKGRQSAGEMKAEHKGWEAGEGGSGFVGRYAIGSSLRASHLSGWRAATAGARAWSYTLWTRPLTLCVWQPQSRSASCAPPCLCCCLTAVYTTGILCSLCTVYTVLLLPLHVSLCAAEFTAVLRSSVSTVHPVLPPLHCSFCAAVYTAVVCCSMSMVYTVLLPLHCRFCAAVCTAVRRSVSTVYTASLL